MFSWETFKSLFRKYVINNNSVTHLRHIILTKLPGDLNGTEYRNVRELENILFSILLFTFNLIRG